MLFTRYLKNEALDFDETSTQRLHMTRLAPVDFQTVSLTLPPPTGKNSLHSTKYSSRDVSRKKQWILIKHDTNVAHDNVPAPVDLWTVLLTVDPPSTESNVPWKFMHLCGKHGGGMGGGQLSHFVTFTCFINFCYFFAEVC